MKKLVRLLFIPLCLALASCNDSSEESEVKVTAIAFNKASANVYVGDSFKLKTKIYPTDATDTKITWSSSDKSIATVEGGKITALKEGEVTITAKNKKSGVTKSLPVKVKEIKEEERYDSYTILMYVCGANLESDYAESSQLGGIGLATRDILEILSVPNKPDDINIVIETGGAKKWTTAATAGYGDYDIRSDKLQIHHVEDNKIVLDRTLDTYTSMGNYSTLQSFIEYGLTYYPADKTGLVLWNHGGGIQGVCFDEKKSSDGLSTTEVTTAVSGALSSCGMSGQKLEWIGYDACLMSVQDIAEKNSQYFNYMVSAEETESGYGWAYQTWIDDLYRKRPTEAFLEALVDGFIDDNGGINSSRNDQTLAVLDLRKMSAYKTAWENMSGALKKIINSGNSEKFNADLIKKTKYYAGEYVESYGLFDAKDFVNKLAANSTFNPGESYINAVLETHKDVVLYSAIGKGAGKSYGMCMYYTYSWRTSWYNDYSFTSFINWKYIVDTYGG